MVQELVEYASSLGWIQWSAFITSIIYVILAAKENIWCWLFGLVSVILSFVIYIQTKLYSDASLQVFYMIMSIYGWIQWKQHPKNTKKLITTLTFRTHLLLFVTGLLGTFLLGRFWISYGAALPYTDAFTTSFSMITTFLVARKILENWLYWIVIDTVCVLVYIQRDIPLFALLFFIYAIIAIFGWLHWRKTFQQSVHF